MKQFFTSLLQDERGQQSTKRILAILGMLFLCGTMTANSFSHEEIKPSAELVSAIEFIVIACIGATSLDKFSSLGGKKSE
ncbi:MAG: hypothetical protein JHC73_21125 [Dolichospermum sp.]|nr:hypothetical protein [Dolichospermum sp.]